MASAVIRNIRTQGKTENFTSHSFLGVQLLDSVLYALYNTNAFKAGAVVQMV